MESATVEKAATDVATGSKTLADLFPLATQKHGPNRAVMYKDPSGQWVTKTYAEVGEIVKSLSLGLMDLGIEKGDKVAILANTRPEWTYYDFAALSAGATVVPIYQTNSPEECQYVLENSDSVAVICENEEQLAKVRAVKGQCPKLEHVILMEARPTARSRWTSWRSEVPAARTPTGRRAGARSPRTTSARSSTRPGPPARRRAASSRTATTARC
jgi:long-chain acyl-CoA synthetase